MSQVLAFVRMHHPSDPADADLCVMRLYNDEYNERSQRALENTWPVFVFTLLYALPADVELTLQMHARFVTLKVFGYTDIFRYDGELKRYVELLIADAKPKGPDRSHYPHDCPRCGKPAYLGVTPASLDCSVKCHG